MSGPEFDQYSAAYEDLLKDPIRNRFSEEGSAFFHRRKRDLIRAYLRRHAVDSSRMSYLDLGCGKGELLSLLRSEFGRAAGCDPSAGMLQEAAGLETRVQSNPGEIPFASGEFDFITAVCVYHHVPMAARGPLTQEVARVLKPGGTFCIIEHNPYNPATRLIVSRTPVDADAILLPRFETHQLLNTSGFRPMYSRYFLYFPEPIYRRLGDRVERWLGRVPLGGQYAVFASRNPSDSRNL